MLVQQVILDTSQNLSNIDRSGLMFAMPYTVAFPSLTQLGSSVRARTESLRSCSQKLQVTLPAASHEHKVYDVQGFQMPAPLGHEVIDLLDVQRLGGRLDGHQAHVRLAYQLQTINLLHAFCKLLRCLCEHCHSQLESKNARHV